MARYIDAEGLNLYDNLFMSEDTINKSGVYVRYRAVENLIKNAPTADVQEVKRGKWLCINGTIFCSECQGKALYKYNENDNDDFPFLLPMKSKRCPYCGAKMDGEDSKE